MRPESAQIGQVWGGKKGFPGEQVGQPRARRPVLPFQRPGGSVPAPTRVRVHSQACDSCLQARPSWAHGGTLWSGLMGFRKGWVGRAGMAQ